MSQGRKYGVSSDNAHQVGLRDERKPSLARAAPLRSEPMAAPFTVLIMAAGHGTRMRSETPKVLHRLCGKPMVEWVIDAAREAGAARVVCDRPARDGVAEGCRTASRSPSSGRARAPAPRCSPRAIRPRPGRSPSCRATTRWSPPSSSRGSWASTRRAEAGRCSPPTSSTRRATAGSCATRRAAVERIVETKYTDRCRPRSSRSARSTSAPTCSTPPALRGARRGRARRTASATSPGSCRRCASEARS